MNTPSTEVGPGLWAFIAFFFLAVALWLLMRSMFTRLRRMTIADRAERQRLEREAAESDELTQRARGMDVPSGHQAADAPGADADAEARDAEVEDSGVGDGAKEGQGRRDEV